MAQSTGGGTARGLYRLEEPPVEELCSGGLECALSDAQLSMGLLFCGTVGVAVLFAFLYLADARAACRREIERVRSERDAFEQFSGRVAEIDPARTPSRNVASGGSTIATAANVSNGTEQVKRAFEETVMAVDHYEEEYDESLGRHLTVELGEDVSTMLQADDALSPNGQQVVVASAAEAQKRRQMLAEAIETERKCLVDATETLADANRIVEADHADRALDRSYDTLDAAWRRLDGAETDCIDLTRCRQERLHNGVAIPGQRWDGFDFCSYLYGSLPVTHPVLASASVVLDRIQTQKRVVLRGLTATA